MSEAVGVKLRGTIVAAMLTQMDQQAKFLAKEKQAPGLALEMVMAQFVAAGMHLCKHAKPELVEDLYKDMMQNRVNMQRDLDSKTEDVIERAIKATAGVGNG